LCPHEPLLISWPFVKTGNYIPVRPRAEKKKNIIGYSKLKINLISVAIAQIKLISMKTIVLNFFDL
jgi:hypothetical protein